MTSTPRVSVVIPTYRRPELLRRSIRSVLEQTFSSLEVVVVDDNGEGHPEQKRTRKVLAEAFDDPRIRYIVNDGEGGGSGARNTGIHHATGCYIAFLDDDEDWEPDKLKKQVALLDSAPSDVGVIDSGFLDHKADGRIRTVRPKMQGWILERLLRKTGGRAPKLSTLLCRREVFDTAGAFDASLPARQDYDLYIRIARHFRFESVMEPLANKRSDADQRITGNINNFIEGFEGLYRKIAPDLRTRPKTHAIYLLKQAEVLALGGQQKAARQKYLQALRLWWFNPRLVPYGLKVLRKPQPTKD
ncbi:glycosyltransferase family 2 protein [Thioalkalivibrio sp. ALMg11]|uniref:glycosyltransferase family 2 protein n=1 Tax=Thioalkalivibrio sp. ALMg11 TaxID=1158165 RepID=UPI0003603DC5|nr:glycosyltransferase family 2 protein [Thioalkalivibrio sp. ALMg11]